MVQKLDVIIRNGHVIDTSRGIDKKTDLAILNRKFAEAEKESAAAAEFDAEGCFVVPGLIDFHCHFAHKRSKTGLNPDMAFIPSGVTTVVDQGSTGVSTCRDFIDSLARFDIQSRIMLHVTAQGQIDCGYSPEAYVPEKWDRTLFHEAFEYGNGRIIGLKMRASRNAVTETGPRAFYESVKLADDLGRMLTVHLPDPPLLQSEIASALRPGDVMSHIFHGVGNTIFEGNKIAPEIWRAKERGVYMDIAHGGYNFSYDVARRAIAEGFFPDTISSDQTTANWLAPETYSLPYVMSQMLAVGMSLNQVVEAVTSKPAEIIGLKGTAGTLAPGARADICIFKLCERETVFHNAFGESCRGEMMIVPQAVFLNGVLVYKPLDSAVTRKNRDFARGV